MTGFAQETNRAETRIRSIPFQRLIAAAVAAAALAVPAVGVAETMPDPQFHVVSSKPQRPYHTIAKRILVPPILEAIGGCESGGGPNSPGDYTKESDDPHSSASGKYQILDSTWKFHGHIRRAKNAPPWMQDEKAVQLYEEQGLSPWYESRKCWAGKLALR